MAESVRLSKSRYTAGLQCHKQLWWRVHDPEAPELIKTPGLQNILDQGAEVGLRAREIAPGGALIGYSGHDTGARVAATQDALRSPVPVIYEGAFQAGAAYAEVDILERAPGGCRALEVKASSRVKPEHLPDLAFQVHVLREAGIPVERAELVHLNRECRYPDLSNLFVREDLTPEVEGVLVGVPAEVGAQLAMLRGPLPQVEVGEHCTSPRDCPFLKRCWPALPAHHVSTLYRIDSKQIRAYQAEGYDTIADLPNELELSIIHQRQVRAVQTGQIVVEPSLTQALQEFSPPLAFLDFETISLAIPRFAGCHPWEQVPVQFSVHSEKPGGGYTHHEWLASGPEDPRGPLAEALIQACAGANRVVAYHAPFERDCMRRLAQGVPELAGELQQIEEKLVDLLPTIRNHVYHPDFDGHFSIKKVLPALVPSLSYADLVIGDGEVATVELLRLMFKEMPARERATLRKNLLAYCKLDTWAMVKLLERLRGFGGRPQLELF